MGCLLFTGCGPQTSSNNAENNEELTQFRTEVDTFCDHIRSLDQQINSIDTTKEGFETELMSDLDKLQSEFYEFSQKDFPTDYDYLEDLADEAKDYMTTAVDAFRDVYTNPDYTEAMMDAQYEYATENYSRAYKRITVILTFLNGEVDADATVGTKAE
jgi:hypothetical protein